MTWKHYALSLLLGSLFFLFTHRASADTFELNAGGLTYHVLGAGASHNFAHQLSSDGRLIDNPVAGFSLTKEAGTFYATYAVFGGEESVGGPMAGGFYQSGITNGILQIGYSLGGYFQRDSDFTNRGVIPFRLTEVNNTDFVPLVGIALNYKLKLNDNIYLKLATFISPIILNSSLALGWSF